MQLINNQAQAQGRLKDVVFRDEVTTQTETFACLLSACISVDFALIRPLHSSIPRHAQAYFNMHAGYFERLPLQIFANIAVDVPNTAFMVQLVRGILGHEEAIRL
ncbi:hypothetical protein TNCV_2105361 [Trichonephila clavipes]|nr:hypothetical protein TNCV_2105361 [Trichonephila clavipes]